MSSINKKSVEEMEVETSKLTNKELQKLHKEYNDTFLAEKESDSESEDSDSEDEPKETHKYVLKNLKSSKKDTTMLYMFKKYEVLQEECNTYKNKLYKMRIRSHTEEQKQHYKNLEFSNLLLEKQSLQKDLEQKRYTNFKYYISLTTNLLLTGALVFVYQFYNDN
jgi:hypothetical protein